jgi:TPR repeat protein
MRASLILPLITLVTLPSYGQEPPAEARTKLLAAQKSSVQRADAGDPFQQLRINDLLTEIGQPSKYDYPAILKGFEILAQSKDSNAIYCLATLVGSDYPGIQKDMARRKSLMQEAASLGQPQAMLEHARWVWEDQKNADLALDWWLRGREALIKKAEAGNKQAMSDLWFLGSPAGLQNHARVRKLDLFLDGTRWLRRSSEAGDVEAMLNLGYRLVERSGALVKNEEGREKLEREGVRWLEKAAAKGNWEAMVRLGQVCSTGMPWVTRHADPVLRPAPTDPAKAWYWWDKAITIVGKEKVMDLVDPSGEAELPPRPAK